MVAAEEATQPKKINIDEICRKIDEKKSSQMENAIQEFKEIVLQDIQDKIIRMAHEGKDRMSLFQWNTGHMPNDVDEKEEQLFRRFNGERPFDMINETRDENGKFTILSDFEDVISEMCETSKEGNKIIVKYRFVNEKKIKVGTFQKTTKTWEIYMFKNNKNKTYYKKRYSSKN